jgi:multicomponent Na+:H+ antiporter subunit D
MKICLFLCAGAFMHQTGKTHVYHMDGMGKRMKVVFGCFAISGLGLMGVPGLAGFISKWNLTVAAVESGNVLAYVGIAGLLLSAFLTAIYILSVVVRAYFPKNQTELAELETARDPSWRMCLPLVVCAVSVIVLGFCSEPLIDFFRAVAQGLV